MEAIAWTALGLLAATLVALVAALFSLGSRIDALGASLNARIDSLEGRLSARLDTLTERLSEHIATHR